MTEPLSPLLSMRGISKSFGSKVALAGVDLRIYAGEIHGLLGGNGAGKTSLMNILFGLYHRDAGSIDLDGRPLEVRRPKDAIAARIGMVHQTFLQVDNHTALENIVAGAAAIGHRRNSPSSARSSVLEVMESSGLKVDLDAKVRDLPLGERQRIEILKALYRRARLLILDEPTTNLTADETASLYDAIRLMSQAGMAVIVITHKIHDALNLCDRVTVMNTGTVTRTATAEATSVRELIDVMMPTGADVDAQRAIDAFLGGVETSENHQSRPSSMADTRIGDDTASAVMTVRELVVGTPPAVKGVDLELLPGRVVGLAGVAGNGQRQLLEALAGVVVPVSGQVHLDGRNMTGQSTAQWLDLAVAYVGEDRHRDGILPGLGLPQNYVLGHHRSKDIASRSYISWRRAAERTRAMVAEFAISVPDLATPVGNLSGGNIQRLILARAFAHHPKVLLLHNPTRGLDIPSVVFVYEQVKEAARRGASVVVASEDLDELFYVCDEIQVMYSGSIRERWPRSGFDAHLIEQAMAGGLREGRDVA